MTKTLLGNLATFNSVLQLSLPPSASMNSNHHSYQLPADAMSTFFTGFKPNSLDSLRQHSRISTNSYDPFSSHASYPPTRGVQQTFEDYDAPALHSFEEPHTSRRNSVLRTTVVENSVRRSSQESSYGQRTGSPESQVTGECEVDRNRRGSTRYHSRRRAFNQDEFDGPSQYLPLPLPVQDSERAGDLIQLPMHLSVHEQDEILQRTNGILSECAFHFVAKYQFPVPLERDKPRVRSPADREWTEWAYLLKRLATKRRIPARVLFEHQIKQLVTTLENSIVARQSTSKDQSTTKRLPKDDRYILQAISASTQVAKILMDSLAMEQLNELYSRTEAVIFERRRAGY